MGEAATRKPRRQPPSRHAIINADDFAFTPAVTAGILEAHSAGIVTSTSMMVHCPGWDDGVRRARAMPTLDVGLHVNLLVGAPLSAAPSLRGPDGQFLSLRALVRGALLGSIRARDVTEECDAQLSALYGAGIRVTHVDSHRHTHALPVVCGAIARVAAARRLPLRRPVESHGWFWRDAASQWHRALIGGSWRVASLAAPWTRAPDHFVGVSLQHGNAFRTRLEHVLATLSAGTTEIMVHPGYVDDTLIAMDGYTHQREVERLTLVDPLLRDHLIRYNVALTNFNAL